MHIRIVTFLLKLSSQWVKYALACVYIDLPIGEIKKKKRKCLSSFMHNVTCGRTGDCLFSSYCRPPWQRKIAEKKGKTQFKRRCFHVPNLIPV